MDRPLRGCVDAPRRLVAEEHPASRREPSAQHHLLLIAPRELADRLLDRRAIDLHPRPDRLGRPPLRSSIDPAAPGPRLARQEEGIDPHRLAEEEPVVTAILRKHADSGGHGLTGGTEEPGAAISAADAPGRGGIGAKDRPEEFGSPSADKSSESDHFAAADHEAHAPDSSAAGEPCDGQDDVSRGGRPGGRALGRGTSRHLLDELLRGDVPPDMLGDKAAITEDADAAGDPREFVEPMGNVDDRHPLTHEAADVVKEKVALPSRKRCGRLVEDEDAAAPVEGPGDLDELALADTEPGKRHPRIEVAQADALERHDGPAAERGPVDEAEAVREAVEEQVFGKAHPGEEVHLLEHHHHPRFLGGGS